MQIENLSTDPGISVRVLSHKHFAGLPCLFLDRDGVQVEETNYLHRVEDVRLIPGVAEAIAQVNAAGLPVVMVTNQAGIGRGYYEWHEFDTVQDHIFTQCRLVGAHYTMALACAYHAEGITPYAVADHPWRKPAPGMLFESARALGIDLAASTIIGDTLNDLDAGARAGLGSGTLVLTGHGQREWSSICDTGFAAWSGNPRFVADVAPDAGTAILRWLATVSRAQSGP